MTSLRKRGATHTHTHTVCWRGTAASPVPATAKPAAGAPAAAAAAVAAATQFVMVLFIKIHKSNISATRDVNGLSLKLWEVERPLTV